MNSADKSISLIDAALRRRFSFIEQRPNAEMIDDQTLKNVFIKLNQHLTDALGSADLLIGHSYFMDESESDLPVIFNENIIPLLYEYFYDNKKSVLKALGAALDGLEMEVNRKHKTSEEKEIQSAFVKGNTQMLVLTFFPNDKVNDIVSNQSVKVKFEIDTDNPSGGIVESKYSLLPSPYEVKVFDKTTLFAGKVHAIICRDYKNRVKGRDYYDYLFYCARDVKLNLKYLENKLKNSKKIDNSVVLDITLVKKMLKDKFESLDYEAAKKDVSNFIKNQSSLNIWGKDLFLSTIDKLC